jgi:hypothetical protein
MAVMVSSRCRWVGSVPASHPVYERDAARSTPGQKKLFKIFSGRGSVALPTQQRGIASYQAANHRDRSSTYTTTSR